MSLRHTLGEKLEKVIGPEATSQVRKTEYKVRRQAAQWVQPATNATTGTTPQTRPAPAAAPSKATGSQPFTGPAKPKTPWQKADPLADFPTPPLHLHEFLTRLHHVLQPRTYLEIGIFDGRSLRLSRTRTIGIDPEFAINREIECDVQLARATSDDFFAREDALRHFEGVPLDFAFIDGLHFAEYAYRDFLNVEKAVDAGGIIVLDDMLPRNALEAARDRKTSAWAGDVYKVGQILQRRRPDLIVHWVNTAPTGTLLVAKPDPTSTVLSDVYDDELSYLKAPDPQTPPEELLTRQIAVDPRDILDIPLWDSLIASREDPSVDLGPLWAELAAVPKLGDA